MTVGPVRYLSILGGVLLRRGLHTLGSMGAAPGTTPAGRTGSRVGQREDVGCHSYNKGLSRSYRELESWDGPPELV